MFTNGEISITTTQMEYPMNSHIGVIIRNNLNVPAKYTKCQDLGITPVSYLIYDNGTWTEKSYQVSCLQRDEYAGTLNPGQEYQDSIILRDELGRCKVRYRFVVADDTLDFDSNEFELLTPPDFCDGYNLPRSYNIISGIQNVVKNYFCSLDPALDDRTKMEQFCTWLESHDCVSNAELRYMSFKDSDPKQSEIHITFKDIIFFDNRYRGNEIAMDIFMTNPPTFARYHELNAPDAIHWQIGNGMMKNIYDTESIIGQNLIIKNQPDWNDFLKIMDDNYRHGIKNFTELDIDFSKYFVIAIIDTIELSTPSYVNITDIVEYNDSIVFSITSDRGYSSAFSLPFQIIKYPRSDKEFIFRHYSSKKL